MSILPHNEGLHLPDLSIKGLRGIKNLTISRLGRVTLFAGKNGIGKTTLLDAVRIYASRGRLSVLTNILETREEVVSPVVDKDDAEEVLIPNFKALFYDRLISRKDVSISVGPRQGDRRLSIKYAPLSEERRRRLGIDWIERFSEEELQSLLVEFQGKSRETPFFFLLRDRRYRGEFKMTKEYGLMPEIRCKSVGPSILSNRDMAEFWSDIALTNGETLAAKALGLIFGDKVERVAVIDGYRHKQRVVVKIKGQDHPVSLKSLGDGAVRLFGVALVLANSQGGFLVIDESENGIHHSVQRDFWKMVLRTARDGNVQVLATTHSWDCVVGFAQASKDLDDVEGVLVRLESDEDGCVRAIEYSQDELKIAAEQGIEVR